MNKRSIAAIFAACILFLSGCQLAQPDGETAVPQDMLVGVFVTTEYLDLFDAEAYLHEHMDQLVSGNIPSPDTSSHSDRIYAARTEKVSDGITTSRYAFTDLEGILMASYRITDIQGPYWSSEVTNGMSDVSFGHNSRDDGCDVTINGCIYVSCDTADLCFYFNPVYQTQDGQVYLVPGDGMHIGGDFGGSATHTLQESSSITENGSVSSYSSEIAVTVKAIDPAESITVIQMDENSRILRQDTYTPDGIPDTLTPDAATAYLIVQEHTAQSIRRSLYQRDDTYLSVFQELTNDICTKNQPQLNWQ